MIRVVKDPEVRRDELVDAAEELFSDKGYEVTAVSDIVSKVGVAQGTFYYYFRSKDEILDAIVDRFEEKMRKEVENLTSKSDLDAVEMILRFYGIVVTFGQSQEKLVNYLHEEKNALLHLKMEKKINPIMIPLFERIIQQGIEEGLFNTQYPMEAAVALLVSTNTLQRGRVQVDKQRLEAMCDLAERILGAEPRTFMKHALRMRLIE
jgi:AcrR family transcriptional regulator